MTKRAHPSGERVAQYVRTVIKPLRWEGVPMITEHVYKRAGLVLTHGDLITTLRTGDAITYYDAALKAHAALVVGIAPSEPDTAPRVDVVYVSTDGARPLVRAWGVPNRATLSKEERDKGGFWLEERERG